MSENIELVNGAILSYVLDRLSNKYPEYFSIDKVFWSDTISERPEMPYCYLYEIGDDSLGDTTEVDDKRDSQGKYLSTIEIDRSVITLSINVCTMKDVNLSGLQAKNLAKAITRYLRRLFKSPQSLDYFQYENEYYTPIAITYTSDLRYIPDFEDTTTKFKFSFDVSFAFHEVFEDEIDTKKAMGMHAEVNNEEEININL